MEVIFDDSRNMHIASPQNPLGTILFLHGYKQTGESFVELFKNSSLQYRILLPNATPVYGRWKGFAGFINIWQTFHYLGDRQIHGNQTRQAARLRQIVIEEQVDFIGGYSNGGGMALYLATQFLDFPIKGVFVLSGFHKNFEIRNKIPIFIYHSKLDPIVNYEKAMEWYEQRLKAEEYELFTEEIDKHKITKQELQWLSKWLGEKSAHPRLQKHKKIAL